MMILSLNVRGVGGYPEDCGPQEVITFGLFGCPIILGNDGLWFESKGVSLDYSPHMGLLFG